MTRASLQVYNRMPYSLRCAAASLQGIRIQRTRYGGATGALVDQAVDRESWTVERWRTWRGAALARQLENAARRVPFYREDRPLIDGPIAELSSWPVLGKPDLLGHEARFVRDVGARGPVVREHTSGTTGTPLSLTLSRSSVRSWYALFRARTLQWNGVNPGDRWAMLGGQLVANAERTSPPYWVWNAAARQLYLSSFHLSDRSAGAYAATMVRHRVTYLLGYPSAMASLARAIEATGSSPPRLRVAISNAEPLFPEQREVIGRVFGCEVRDTYGMSEAVAGASECAHGSLHLWPEAGVVEILDDDGDPVPDGRVGRIVCTGLLNDVMPLIRYDLGDRGALVPEDAPPCACGRLLPRLKEVTGRDDDVVVTPDGRQIGRLDGVFKTDTPIREAQIVQQSHERFLVRIVPADAFTEAVGSAISQRLRDRVGDVEVRVELVETIPRTTNGKFRAVISELERRR